MANYNGSKLLFGNIVANFSLEAIHNLDVMPNDGSAYLITVWYNGYDDI